MAIRTTDVSRAVRILAMLAAIAALYLARDILLPAALAVLLAFLLNPMVEQLRRWGLHRVVAVILAVGAAGLVTLVLGGIMLTQAAELTTRIPDYQDNLKQKIRNLRSSADSQFARFTGTMRALQEEIESTTQTVGDEATAEVTPPNTAEAVKVEVVEDGEAFATVASRWAAPLLVPLANAGVVLVLVIFLLLEIDDVRERLIWIAGTRQMSLTTSALDEVGMRVSRYLRMLLVINLTYGVLVAVSLYLLGLPNALLWGVIGGLLRFVPFVGPWIAAALPTLLSAAFFPGWSHTLLIAGMFVVVETFTNMVMEPWLYGTSTGISTLGVVCAAIFWAWIWGAVGLIMAVPITVLLVVVGKYVPQLALFHQLFGADDAVPDVARLYQRLLAGDEDSAEEILTQRLEEGSFAQACDDVLLPVLCEIKRDLANGLIDRVQAREAIRVLEMVSVSATEHTETRPQVEESCPRLLCVPGNSIADEAASRLLARMAQLDSVPAESMSVHALASEVADRVGACGAALVCLVQVSPLSATRLRQIAKMLEHRLGEELKLIEVSIRESNLVALGPARTTTQVKTPSQGRGQESTFVGLLERLGELRLPAPVAESPLANAK